MYIYNFYRFYTIFYYYITYYIILHIIVIHYDSDHGLKFSMTICNNEIVRRIDRIPDNFIYRVLKILLSIP